MKIFAWSLGLAAAISSAILATAVLSSASAETVLSPDGKVRTFIFRQPGKKLDPAKVVPMRLPTVSGPLPTEVEMAIEAAKFAAAGRGTAIPGGIGTGKFMGPPPVALPPSGAAKTNAAATAAVPPPEYGTGGPPYTVARSPNALYFPYREAGLLISNDAGGNIVTCSAALVKPGIVVTAAHCIVPYGSTTPYTNFLYLPAWGPSGASSYGYAGAASASVLPSWTAGTDNCAQPGVCPDDVGVITLMPSNGSAYIGAQTGWFGYSQTNYDYIQGRVEITQLGYAAGFDGGNIMERVDAQATVGSVTPYSRNTIIGSPLGNGSDGGPWVVNLGTPPQLTGQVHGTAPTHNIIVGVTSWWTGTSSSQKQAGASPFTAANIGTLVSNACSATPAAC